MNYRSEGHDNAKMTQVGSACSKKNDLGIIATTSLQIAWYYNDNLLTNWCASLPSTSTLVTVKFNCLMADMVSAT